MTLVELLVVIVLLTTLVTTAIPVMAPGGEDRKLREASRGLNSYLQGAQVRAMETGRPFGVAMRRLSADTGRGEDNAVCVQVRYVEVPPAYSGFSGTSKVRIAANPLYAPNADTNNAGDDDAGPLLMQFLTRGAASAGLPVGWTADLVPQRFLRPGDTVEVANRRYRLLDPQAASIALLRANGEDYFTPDTGTLVSFAVEPVDGASLLAIRYDRLGRALPSPEVLSSAADSPAPQNWGLDVTPNDNTWPPVGPFWTLPQSYKIYRQPVSAGGEPLELPSGVAIDLQASAFGNGVRLYSPHVDYDESENAYTNVRNDDVMILFAPEGHIQRVYGHVAIDPNQLNGTTVTSLGQVMDPTPVTSYLGLCIGRRELIPAQLPTGSPGTTRAEIAEPLNLATDLAGLSETEALEVTEQYNWLNLESRWVVVGGQSGSVTSIENSAIFTEGLNDPFPVGQQIARALENAPRRTAIGGR